MLSTSTVTIASVAVFASSRYCASPIASAAMSFTGSITDINNALNNAVFTPTANFHGAASLRIETGDGTMLALWDLHHDSEPVTKTGISIDLGLPHFVNHIAFAAADLDDLDARKDRLLAHGFDVARIDHGWCTSIYTADPNDIMVEFCCTTRVFDAADHAAVENQKGVAGEFASRSLSIGQHL
mgnify:CR=1 FL=1